MIADPIKEWHPRAADPNRKYPIALREKYCNKIIFDKGEKAKKKTEELQQKEERNGTATKNFQTA